MTTYVVETVGHRGFYDGAADVLMEVSPGTFTPVNVANLEQIVNAAGQNVESGLGGVRVLLHRQGINRTINELDSAGIFEAASPRYARAKSLLFQEGTGRPMLQQALRGGLIPEADGRELTQEEVRVIAEAVHETVRAGGIHITYDSVRSWVTGEVVSPQDKSVYGALQKVHPYFAKFAADEEATMNADFDWSASADNLAAAYHVWKTVRSGVMSYLSNNGKRKKRSEREEKQRQKLSLGNELRYVSDHFASEVSDDYSAVLVTRVVRMADSEGEAGRKKEGPLRKGLLRDGSATGVRVLSQDEREYDCFVLHEVLRTVAFTRMYAPPEPVSNESSIEGALLNFEEIARQFRLQLTGQIGILEALMLVEGPDAMQLRPKEGFSLGNIKGTSEFIRSLRDALRVYRGLLAGYSEEARETMWLDRTMLYLKTHRMLQDEHKADREYYEGQRKGFRNDLLKLKPKLNMAARKAAKGDADALRAKQKLEKLKGEYESRIALFDSALKEWENYSRMVEHDGRLIFSVLLQRNQVRMTGKTTSALSDEKTQNSPMYTGQPLEEGAIEDVLARHGLRQLVPLLPQKAKELLKI